jgi:hypothetical protein
MNLKKGMAEVRLNLETLLNAFDFAQTAMTDSNPSRTRRRTRTSLPLSSRLPGRSATEKRDLVKANRKEFAACAGKVIFRANA